MADKGPRSTVRSDKVTRGGRTADSPVVLTGVQLKLGRGLLPLPSDLRRVAGKQHRALRETAERLRKDVEVGLVRKPDAVLGVLHVS